MADIFSFEEGNDSKNSVNLNSREALDSILRKLSVHTEVESRVHDVLIRVQEFAGGSEFLAKGMGDTFLLKSMAHRVEKRGSFTLYYVKLDGKRVELP